MVKDLGRVNAFPEITNKKEADTAKMSASFIVCEAL